MNVWTIYNYLFVRFFLFVYRYMRKNTYIMLRIYT